jgi:hypothetical protein
MSGQMAILADGMIDRRIFVMVLMCALFASHSLECLEIS